MGPSRRVSTGQPHDRLQGLSKITFTPTEMPSLPRAIKRAGEGAVTMPGKTPQVQLGSAIACVGSPDARPGPSIGTPPPSANPMYSSLSTRI